LASVPVYGGGDATVGATDSTDPVGGGAGVTGDPFGSTVNGVFEFWVVGLFRKSQNSIPPMAKTPIIAKKATFHGLAPDAGGWGRAET
jgi:hypothetical protein